MRGRGCAGTGGPCVVMRAARFLKKMPLYLYKGRDGVEREVFMHGNQPPQIKILDGEPLQRVVIAPFAFVGKAPKPTLGQEIMRGYREHEIECGSRFHSKLNHETVKRAWANDASDEQ